MNAGVGFRWLDDKVTTSLKLVNLANSAVQQHVFGDITKFQAVGEIKVFFPGVGSRLRDQGQEEL